MDEQTCRAQSLEIAWQHAMTEAPPHRNGMGVQSHNSSVFG